MKLKIYDEKEEGIYLKLEERSNRIVVVAVDESGNRIKNLLEFTKEGTIYLCESAECGDFKTDKKGRIETK